MANDPITGACDVRSQTQSSTSRPRPEVEEHFQPGQGTSGVSQQSGASKENLKQKGKDAANRLSATADEATRQVKEQAGKATRRIREQGESVVARQKDRVAEEVSHFGAAAHEAANKLDQEGDCNIAHYVHLAGDQLDDAARYIRESNLSRLADDMTHMARRRPELFFGGMFIAGMALTRFLKASSRPRRYEAYDEFDENAAWEDEFEDEEGLTVAAGATSLYETREGALSGDIAGTTAPRPLPPSGPAGTSHGTTPTGTTPTIGGAQPTTQETN